MIPLSELNIANLKWRQDEDGLAADGLLSYEIDLDMELAVFQGEKCLAIREANGELHAIFLAEAFEREAKRNKLREENWRGRKDALI
jgi:hypothetical protein